MKTYGILAFPAGHSLSPAIHNAGFDKLGIDAKYEVFEVAENELDGFMRRVRSGEISGLSVSLPYKERIMEYLDSVDENARNIGAVNTVVFRDGNLEGYNTDFIGSNKALEEVLGSLSGLKAMVLGAGGASRAICYGLLKEGSEVIVLNRGEGRAIELANELGKFGVIEGRGLDMWSEVSGDILVQASSIWTLQPDMSEEQVDEFVPDEFVGKFRVVMDIVYKPLKTPLIVKAERLGKVIVTGDKMLLYQAAEQFRLWTGREMPVGGVGWKIFR